MVLVIVRFNKETIDKNSTKWCAHHDKEIQHSWTQNDDDDDDDDGNNGNDQKVLYWRLQDIKVH